VACDGQVSDNPKHKPRDSRSGLESAGQVWVAVYSFKVAEYSFFDSKNTHPSERIV
jgi:hypothetical protein